MIWLIHEENGSNEITGALRSKMLSSIMKCEQFFQITSVLWLNVFVEPVPRNGVVIVTATYPCQQKTPQK
jgi:hypothetical protein